MFAGDFPIVPVMKLSSLCAERTTTQSRGEGDKFGQLFQPYDQILLSYIKREKS